MQQFIDAFTEYLKVEKNVSEHTCRNYISDLMMFKEYVDRDIDIKAIDNLAVRGFLGLLSRKGEKKSSIARRLSVLRTFFKYLHREGYVEINPAKIVATPKQEKMMPAFLSVDDAFSLMEMPVGADVLTLRDKAILETFYSTGIRIGELAGLNDPDIDFTSGLVKVRGKGRKERIVPIGEKAMTAIKII